MSLGLTIYPIQFSNLFTPGATVLAENNLSFTTNTALLAALKQSKILQPLLPGMSIEYRNGEETYVTTKSLRIGEALLIGYGNSLQPWLKNYLGSSEALNNWDGAIVQFLLVLPSTTPIIFNWQ